MTEDQGNQVIQLLTNMQTQQATFQSQLMWLCTYQHAVLYTGLFLLGTAIVGVCWIAGLLRPKNG